MSAGLPSRHHRAPDRLHHALHRLTPALVMTAFALSLLIFPTPSTAGESWQHLWCENFDQPGCDGWTLQAYRNTDRIGVVLEGDGDSIRRCDNNVLYGRSFNTTTGYGFAARTPTLESMGIDGNASRYEIAFRYMLPDARFCWTVPLASPNATLMVSECSPDGTKGRLGLVDENFGNFQFLTEITVGDWHDIEVSVRRAGPVGDHEIRVLVDGQFVGSQIRQHASTFRSFVFTDLPARPVDAQDPDSATGSSFGSGYWDDIDVRALVRTPDDPGKVFKKVRVEPTPFNPSTSLKMNLETAMDLGVTVYDTRGRFIRTLHSGEHPAGDVDLRWDGRDTGGREVSSGVYLFQIITPDRTTTVRGILVR